MLVHLAHRVLHSMLHIRKYCLHPDGFLDLFLRLEDQLTAERVKSERGSLPQYRKDPSSEPVLSINSDRTRVPMGSIVKPSYSPRLTSICLSFSVLISLSLS